MARFLVTGGAGFIGCNLARHILAKGHQVVVLDDFSTGKRSNISDILGDIKLVEGDIRDRKTVDEALAGCSAVFHEAALGSVPRSIAEPARTHDANVNGTVSLLEAARAAGVRRIIFAASSSAYGEQPQSPKHEEMVPSPISPYAAGKVACELYMQAYAAVYGMETLCLRYFNVFGPYQDPQGAYAAAIPAFVSAMLQGQPPVIYGDGEQSRDFCYVQNVCEANWLAAHAPAAVCKGQPINIACNKAVTLNQILAQLGGLLGAKAQVRYEPPRLGDVRHSLASIDRAKAVIGYQPKIFFEEGLAKAIEWYKLNLA